MDRGLEGKAHRRMDVRRGSGGPMMPAARCMFRQQRVTRRRIVVSVLIYFLLMVMIQWSFSPLSFVTAVFKATRPNTTLSGGGQRVGTGASPLAPSVMDGLTVSAAGPLATKVMDKWMESAPSLFAVSVPVVNDDYMKKQPIKVNRYRHSFLQNASKLCAETPYMLIQVNSATQNREKRDAIRATWGKAVSNSQWPPDGRLARSVKLAFIVGVATDRRTAESLQRESLVHTDIIQGDFVDSYQNMTLKSLLGLKWASEFCRGFRMLLKSDDDMIINVPLLLRLLKEKQLKRSIFGAVIWGARVKRRGKWALPDFKLAQYPPYEAGAAYVMTADIVSELFNMSEYVRPIFIDDVYITGILGQMIGVKHVHHPGFARATSRVPNTCSIVRNRIVTGTKLTPARLISIWNNIGKIKC